MKPPLSYLQLTEREDTGAGGGKVGRQKNPSRIRKEGLLRLSRDAATRSVQTN